MPVPKCPGRPSTVKQGELLWETLHRAIAGLPMTEATQFEVNHAIFLGVHVNTNKEELPVCSPLENGAERLTLSLLRSYKKEEDE